jgi:excisionase family DNA binding protein
MSDVEELQTVPEFAKEHRVAENTVRKWIRKRIIPAIKIGSVMRIPRYRAIKALEERTNVELAA